MSDDPDTTTARSFEEKYNTLRSEVAQRTRRSALGSALPNGYTTAEQAGRLAGLLGLSKGQRLLDLGAGRGWPGSHIAALTGCSLVTTDLPMEALLTGRALLTGPALPSGRALPSGDSFGATAVCADGRRLPFGDSVFDAVCHADVLC